MDDGTSGTRHQVGRSVSYIANPELLCLQAVTDVLFEARRRLIEGHPYGDLPPLSLTRVRSAQEASAKVP